MDLNARVDVNCGRKDGRMDRQMEGQKTGCLYRTLLKLVLTKVKVPRAKQLWGQWG